MASKRVLITGADGLIGGILRDRLAGQFDFRLLTRSPIDERSHVADIADLQAIRPAFRDVDAVVHLAASSSVESDWPDVLDANLVGAYNVFEAARETGVGQLVFASSNHVIGGYEVDGAPEIYEHDDGRVYDEHAELRPDSLYGVSKVFGEALGRYYADRHGLRVICLRIGWMVEDDSAPDTPRGRTIWLSHADCAELFRCALNSDVRWAVAYGTSDNPRQIWDLTSARELIGFRPRDRAPDS
ncbi:MAG TPA: NAD(P)-dependent oxidoreductase [Candidatus Limnocylindria bacterium]|jgi:NAD+ dependent glucose-6-phosphate dehydrogenase|nr:NAD(P)-dependent oxidoreductase [Candidatus Limnocylindria bacterium]